MLPKSVMIPSRCYQPQVVHNDSDVSSLSQLNTSNPFPLPSPLPSLFSPYLTSPGIPIHEQIPLASPLHPMTPLTPQTVASLIATPPPTQPQATSQSPEVSQPVLQSQQEPVPLVPEYNASRSHLQQEQLPPSSLSVSVLSSSDEQLLQEHIHCNARCLKFQQRLEQVLQLKRFINGHAQELTIENGTCHKSQSLVVCLPNYQETDTCFGQQIISQIRNPREKNRWKVFEDSANLLAVACSILVNPTDPSITKATSSLLTFEEWIPRWMEAMKHYNNENTKYKVCKHNLFIKCLSRDLFVNNSFSDTLFGDIYRIAQELKDYLEHIEHSENNNNDDIVDWDSVFNADRFISGFGTLGAQLSIKSRFTISFLTDELLWSSKVNLMTRKSIGVSLWISFKLTDLKLDIGEIKSMLTETKLVSLLGKLNEYQVPFSFFYQYPGTMVETVCGNGSAHIVISMGSYIEEIAFNRVFSIQGARKWMGFWNLQTPISLNSELATQYGIPCHLLQLLATIIEENTMQISFNKSKKNIDPATSNNKLPTRNISTTNDDKKDKTTSLSSKKKRQRPSPQSSGNPSTKTRKIAPSARKLELAQPVCHEEGYEAKSSIHQQNSLENRVCTRSIPYHNYHKLEKIGQGTYGIVYKAKDKKTGKVLALKTIRSALTDEGLPSTVLREISILKQLHHPNIICLQNVIHTEMNVTLVFELLDQDLKKYIDTHGNSGLDLKIVKHFLFQLLCGVAYCHQHRVLHRDLKPQNLLINTQTHELKVADFGLARHIFRGRYSCDVATLWYRAPEILMGSQKYSSSMDIWSIGCIFAEMVTGRPLFPGTTRTSNQLKTIFKTLGTPNLKVWSSVANLPEYQSNFPVYPAQPLQNVVPRLDADGLDLLQHMLMLDPLQRVRAEQAIGHQYFKDLKLDINDKNSK